MNYKKDISDIYENFILNESFEDDEGLNRFTIEDYTQLVGEGSGSHGNIKIVPRIIEQGIEEGLLKGVKKTKKGFIIYSAVDNSTEAPHMGESSVPALKKYLEKLREIKASKQVD